MRYFKRYWDEPRADEQRDWGCSWWFFETDDSGVVKRQVEVYDHGPTLRYDESRMVDEYGMLADQTLDLAEFAPYEVGQPDFEKAWNVSTHS